MSQCFSGSFAHLAVSPASPGLLVRNACGYFASTAERPAYGCYPENRGRDNVGHAFHFLKALAATANLPAAQAQTLVVDATPDVPITSSDVYLGRLLARAAGGGDTSALVDELLREAWQDKAAWEPEIRLLDRIGHAFGLFSPRSLGELDRQAGTLPQASATLRTYGDAWKAARGDLAQVNLERFLTASPAWQARLAAAPRTPTPAVVRELADDLLGDLAPFTAQAPATVQRLARLRDNAEAAAAATYRMEVRLAVVLRMRAVLTSLAGRHYLATRGTPEERAAHQTLRACEDVHLATQPIDLGPADPEPFPPYTEDLRLAERVVPAWMGIRFKPVGETQRARLGLGEGASAVVTVYPDSPAARAGFEVGDVVIGPPGRAFTERNQIRQWTMLSEIDRPAPLDVVRDGRRLRLTLVPKPFPLKWPELPGPPRVGSAAPPLALAAYRGSLPGKLAGGPPHLLFFWATWCLPCKAALPELLAFEQETRTRVIAITDEEASQLDPFFQRFGEPFPATVAVDEYRRAFLTYGVSGTPTFVLVDGTATVRSYSTGYTPARGLRIDGWSWSRRPAAMRAGSP
jgi:thiol-disulfide isomerase/thioredoxin